MQGCTPQQPWVQLSPAFMDISAARLLLLDVCIERPSCRSQSVWKSVEWRPSLLKPRQHSLEAQTAMAQALFPPEALPQQQVPLEQPLRDGDPRVVLYRGFPCELPHPTFTLLNGHPGWRWYALALFGGSTRARMACSMPTTHVHTCCALRCRSTSPSGAACATSGTCAPTVILRGMQSG